MRTSGAVSEDEPTAASVHVDGSSVVAVVPEWMRGFTCDWWRHNHPTYGVKWMEAGMLTLDLTSTRLRYLTTSLTPALWRIGGTPEDEVVYVVGNPPECPPDLIQNSTNYPGPLCLTMERWTDIVNFAKDTNVHLAFGIDGAYGRKDRHSNFNSTNAREFLRYTAENKLHVFAFELSNEKNGWDADVLAEDFGTIRSYINEFWPDPSNRPILVGPDTAAVSWIQSFVQHAGGFINATTFHTYCNGYTSCTEDMLNPKVLDGCIDSAMATIKYTRAALPDKPNFPVWAGEDGPHSGGGRPNCTDRFADAFWYLDHLATLAKNGIQGFARSTLVGADYGMLNRSTYAPHPDYFAALLWGRLMGQAHLNVTVFTNTSYIRAYASCKATAQSGHSDATGTVTLLILNLDMTKSYSVDVKDCGSGEQAIYQVRSPQSGIYTDGAEFLGSDGSWTDLKLDSNDKLPAMTPQSKSTGPITLPPVSYAFVTYTACQCSLA